MLAFIIALLAPLEQSVAEMDAILKDPQIFQKLRSTAPISRMLRRKQGYLLVTKDQQMFVEIVYKKPDKIGPRTFDLIFHDPITIGNYQDEPLFD